MASFRVALTGGAGAGKSTAAQIFAECGAQVVDADSLAHEFMEPGHVANAAIRSLFGNTIADSEDRIVRGTLRELVFADKSARKALEGILHPLIHEALEQRTQWAQPYALLVIPLLTETGCPPFIDRIVVIEASVAIQKQRLGERGLTDNTINQLLAIQATAENRRALADDILTNNGSRDHLARSIQALHAQYVSYAHAKTATLSDPLK